MNFSAAEHKCVSTGSRVSKLAKIRPKAKADGRLIDSGKVNGCRLFDSNEGQDNESGRCHVI